METILFHEGSIFLKNIATKIPDCPKEHNVGSSPLLKVQILNMTIAG
jgi:hypothetical protein